MQLEQARAEIDAIVTQMSPFRLDLLLSKTRARLKHSIAALRLAGFKPEVSCLPCSFCGAKIGRAHV